MKTLLLLLMPLVALTAQAEKTKDSLQYTISPSLEDNAHLAVHFSYTSDKEGVILLRYENNSWGDKDIFNCIGSFIVSPTPSKVEFFRDSNLIKITTLPNSRSEIKYTIVQDFTEILKNHHRYRPIINKDYFHLLGMRLLILPEELFGDSENKVNLELLWEDLPADGIFHSSFGFETKQKISVKREQLYSSFFVGGDFRRYEFQYKEKPVYFITRGNWKAFKEEEVFGVLKETIAFQYDFWQDSIDSRFSVTLIPTFEEWTETSKSYSLGGSGLTNSFISLASNNEGTQLKQLVWLYNHELLHKWIGLDIKNEAEEKQYWFSEGFTDYYAYKLMLKNDKMPVDEMLKALNRDVLKPHYSSSVRDIPNDAITLEKFWGDVKYHKLPYRRGLLYAMLTDFRIKKKSGYTKSLDNLMFDILRMAREDEKLRFNEELFKKVLGSYLSEDAIADFNDHIILGLPVNFDQELPEGLVMEYTESVPQLRITPDADVEKLITALKF